MAGRKPFHQLSERQQYRQLAEELQDDMLELDEDSEKSDDKEENSIKKDDFYRNIEVESHSHQRNESHLGLEEDIQVVHQANQDKSIVEVQNISMSEYDKFLATLNIDFNIEFHSETDSDTNDSDSDNDSLFNYDNADDDNEQSHDDVSMCTDEGSEEQNLS